MSIKGRKAAELLTIAKFFTKGHHKALENPIQQKIVEKLTEVLEIKSCIIFRLFSKFEDKGITYCKITAGVPIENHTIGHESDLVNHPDIAKIVNIQEKYLIISNPLENSLCTYFKGIIEEKRITEILYIPLRTEIDGEKKTEGVIVIDKMENDGRVFDYEEIEFCCQVGEWLATIINIEQEILDNLRDKILNPLVITRAFIKRIGNSIKLVQEHLKIVDEDMQKLEQSLKKEF